MGETKVKRKVEFIESYWTGGEYGSNYEWSDNHGELIRCRECIRRGTYDCPIYVGGDADHGSPDDWYCADGERQEAKEQKTIVRCKDCKHHLECDYWIENGDDWYCADGERREI